MQPNPATQPLLSNQPPTTCCTRLSNLFRTLFPCLKPKPNESAISTQQEPNLYRQSFLQNIQTQRSSASQTLTLPTSDNSPTKKKQPVFRSAMQGKRMQNQLDQFFQRAKSQDFRMNFPALGFHEDQLLLMGRAENRMLIKLSSVRSSPPAHILQRTHEVIEAQQGKSLFTNTKLDKFWAKRYMLFEKFDYGIKLDEFSWYSAIPEVVSEYLAERAKCATVLVGFSGIGSEAIKFSNTCHTVLTNDKDHDKLECLEHNAVIYGANNIRTLNYQFTELPELKADLVYISMINVRCFSPEQDEIVDLQSHFQTPLSNILKKSLSISNNIIVLLPPNINLDQLGSIFSESLQKYYPKNSSCSLQVQKIYFINNLKYLVAYYGPLANRKIKLIDQLNYIYEYLMTKTEGYFEYKKLVKMLREKYGMVSLLRFLAQSGEADGKGETNLERLLEFVRDKRLLSQPTIEAMTKFMGKKEDGKAADDSEEEKFDGQSQRTLSSVTDQFQSSSMNLSSHMLLTRRTLQTRTLHHE